MTPSIGALLAYDAWVLLASAVGFGLAYVVSGRKLVPSGLAVHVLAPVAGLALRRPGQPIGTGEAPYQATYATWDSVAESLRRLVEPG